MMKAKTKITRLCSILLTLVMLVGLLPTTALATDPATVDFTTDTDAAIDALGGSSVAEWNGTTLTLNGVNFTTTAATAVKLPNGAKIVLAEGTTNTITGGNSASEDCYGIYAEGSLTIEGSGTLNVTAGNASSRSCGIYAVNGKVLINSGTVNANGGAAGGASLGIYSNLNGESNRNSCIIEISGGTVNATGGTATGAGSFGINAEGEVIISGGEVKATGGTGRGSDGIYSGSSKVTINGGTVMAIGGDAPSAGWSVGIYAINGDVTINGGSVTSAANSRADGTFLFKGKVAGSGYKTISFDSNGGLGEMIAYTYADSYTLPANGFTPPADKQFMGWSESLTGEVIETPAIDATDGKTLYAIWKNNAADFTVGNGTAALALLNEAKTGAADSTWDGTTLTLNGVNFTTTAAIPVKLPVGATIVLADGTTNTITSTYSGGSSSYGIYAVSDLTVTVPDGSAGTGTLNVTAGTSGDESYGIYAYRDINISGGTVTATGGAADNYSDGLDADNVTISGGTVTATGGAADYSYGIYAYYDINISGGTVTATGGAADESYGIYADEELSITGGTVIAEAEDNALNKGPSTLPGAYWWRTSNSGAYNICPTSAYTWDASHKYVEIRTANTVTFDANGGSNTMDLVAVVSGEYILPANGFTAPEGKQFKCWSVDGVEKAVGDKITVTADTTVKAVWEDEPVTLSSIAITTEPTKTTYTAGETFDTAGMVVTATYSDSTTAAVTGYTVSPDRALTTGDTSVTISYTEGSVTKTATQTITVNPAASTGGVIIYTPPTYQVESAVSKDADGSVSFSQNSAKKGDAVTITVTPDRYYKVDGVTVKDASGKEIAVTDNGDGTFTFQMPDSKVTVEPVFSWDNPFGDVAETAYYAPAVEWALKNDVTGGTTAATFGPNAPCTRAQAVTFLWRAAGCPEPESSVNPFTDVEEDAYYAKAVLWAVENGITDGTSATAFSPDETCSRGQIVTFLWRAEKSPAAGAANPFTDVETDAYYAGATNWAVENGITEGTGATIFSPNANCTRAQIVTFLYRFFVK